MSLTACHVSLSGFFNLIFFFAKHFCCHMSSPCCDTWQCQCNVW